MQLASCHGMHTHAASSLYDYSLFPVPSCCLTQIGKSRGTEKSLHAKVLEPGLHASENHVLGAWLLRHPHVGALFRARKKLLYAMATVHTADGQLRRLQVAVITCVALAISLAVWSPGTVKVNGSKPSHMALPTLMYGCKHDGNM